MAHAEIGQLNDAWRCIGEALTAVETTKEGLWEAEVHRTAGEIALMSAEPDAAKAQACFEARSRPRVSSKRSPGNSAPPRVSPASGITRGSRSKRANCLPRFTGGLRKGLTRAI